MSLNLKYIQELCKDSLKHREKADDYRNNGELEGALINYLLSTNILYTINDIFKNSSGILKQNEILIKKNLEKSIKKNIKWIIPLQKKLKEIITNRECICDDETDDTKLCIDISNIKTECLTFNDIAGQEAAKQQIKKGILYPILYPRLYPISSKGILFWGPPGTGKTLLAKAFVNELQLEANRKNKDIRILFYAPTGASLKGKFVGETEKNISKYFKCASKQATSCKNALKKNNTNGTVSDVISVLFIDEIEAIAGSRGDDESGMMTNSVNTLLQMMDGVASYDNVVVMGATNYPWKLDDAILRRFDTKIYISLPNENDIKDLIKLNIGSIIGKNLKPQDNRKINKKNIPKTIEDAATSIDKALNFKSKNKKLCDEKSTCKVETNNKVKTFPGICCGDNNEICLKNDCINDYSKPTKIELFEYYRKKYFPILSDNEIAIIAKKYKEKLFSGSDVATACKAVSMKVGTEAKKINKWKVTTLPNPNKIINANILKNGNEIRRFNTYVECILDPNTADDKCRMVNLNKKFSNWVHLKNCKCNPYNYLLSDIDGQKSNEFDKRISEEYLFLLNNKFLNKFSKTRKFDNTNKKYFPKKNDENHDDIMRNFIQKYISDKKNSINTVEFEKKLSENSYFLLKQLINEYADTNKNIMNIDFFVSWLKLTSSLNLKKIIAFGDPNAYTNTDKTYKIRMRALSDTIDEIGNLFSYIDSMGDIFVDCISIKKIFLAKLENKNQDNLRLRFLVKMNLKKIEQLKSYAFSKTVYLIISLKPMLSKYDKSNFRYLANRVSNMGSSFIKGIYNFFTLTVPGFWKSRDLQLPDYNKFLEFKTGKFDTVFNSLKDPANQFSEEASYYIENLICIDKKNRLLNINILLEEIDNLFKDTSSPITIEIKKRQIKRILEDNGLLFKPYEKYDSNLYNDDGTPITLFNRLESDYNKNNWKDWLINKSRENFYYSTSSVNFDRKLNNLNKDRINKFKKCLAGNKIVDDTNYSQQGGANYKLDGGSNKYSSIKNQLVDCGLGYDIVKNMILYSLLKNYKIVIDNIYKYKLIDNYINNNIEKPTMQALRPKFFNLLDECNITKVISNLKKDTFSLEEEFYSLSGNCYNFKEKLKGVIGQQGLNKSSHGDKKKIYNNIIKILNYNPNFLNLNASEFPEGIFDDRDNKIYDEDNFLNILDFIRFNNYWNEIEKGDYGGSGTSFILDSDGDLVESPEMNEENITINGATKSDNNIWYPIILPIYNKTLDLIFKEDIDNEEKKPISKDMQGGALVNKTKIDENLIKFYTQKFIYYNLKDDEKNLITELIGDKYNFDDNGNLVDFDDNDLFSKNNLKIIKERFVVKGKNSSIKLNRSDSISIDIINNIFKNIYLINDINTDLGNLSDNIVQVIDQLKSKIRNNSTLSDTDVHINYTYWAIEEFKGQFSSRISQPEWRKDIVKIIDKLIISKSLNDSNNNFKKFLRFCKGKLRRNEVIHYKLADDSEFIEGKFIKNLPNSKIRLKTTSGNKTINKNSIFIRQNIQNLEPTNYSLEINVNELLERYMITREVGETQQEVWDGINRITIRNYNDTESSYYLYPTTHYTSYWQATSTIPGGSVSIYDSEKESYVNYDKLIDELYNDLYPDAKIKKYKLKFGTYSSDIPNIPNYIFIDDQQLWHRPQEEFHSRYYYRELGHYKCSLEQLLYYFVGKKNDAYQNPKNLEYDHPHLIYKLPIKVRIFFLLNNITEIIKDHTVLSNIIDKYVQESNNGITTKTIKFNILSGKPIRDQFISKINLISKFIERNPQYINKFNLNSITLENLNNSTETFEKINSWWTTNRINNYFKDILNFGCKIKSDTSSVLASWMDDELKKEIIYNQRVILDNIGSNNRQRGLVGRFITGVPGNPNNYFRKNGVDASTKYLAHHHKQDEFFWSKQIIPIVKDALYFLQQNIKEINYLSFKHEESFKLCKKYEEFLEYSKRFLKDTQKDSLNKVTKGKPIYYQIQIDDSNVWNLGIFNKISSKWTIDNSDHEIELQGVNENAFYETIIGKSGNDKIKSLITLPVPNKNDNIYIISKPYFLKNEKTTSKTTLSNPTDELNYIKIKVHNNNISESEFDKSNIYYFNNDGSKKLLVPDSITNIAIVNKHNDTTKYISFSIEDSNYKDIIYHIPIHIFLGTYYDIVEKVNKKSIITDSSIDLHTDIESIINNVWIVPNLNVSILKTKAIEEYTNCDKDKLDKLFPKKLIYSKNKYIFYGLVSSKYDNLPILAEFILYLESGLFYNSGMVQFENDIILPNDDNSATGYFLDLKRHHKESLSKIFTDDIVISIDNVKLAPMLDKLNRIIGNNVEKDSDEFETPNVETKYFGPWTKGYPGYISTDLKYNPKNGITNVYKKGVKLNFINYHLNEIKNESNINLNNYFLNSSIIIRLSGIHLFGFLHSEFRKFDGLNYLPLKIKGKEEHYYKSFEGINKDDCLSENDIKFSKWILKDQNKQKFKKITLEKIHSENPRYIEHFNGKFENGLKINGNYIKKNIKLSEKSKVFYKEYRNSYNSSIILKDYFYPMNERKSFISFYNVLTDNNTNIEFVSDKKLCPICGKTVSIMFKGNKCNSLLSLNKKSPNKCIENISNYISEPNFENSDEEERSESIKNKIQEHVSCQKREIFENVLKDNPGERFKSFAFLPGYFTDVINTKYDNAVKPTLVQSKLVILEKYKNNEELTKEEKASV